MTKRPIHARLSQSDIAIQIQRLVQAIESHDTLAFRFKPTRSGFELIERTRLSRYFDHIQQMVDLFDQGGEYRYSEHLQAFWEACQDVGLERSPGGPVCLDEEETVYLDHHRSMNALVARIRQLIREPWYLRRKDDHRYQARQQETGIVDYVDSVLDRYSRSVVVRVDLFYLSVARARLRAEHVFDDLDKLMAERVRNPIFEHLTGYICSVEQGESRGYHIHAAFFFNGAEVRGDLYKAQQIGELWEHITRGQGCFHSCNHDKARYGERCGVGTLRRNDRKARANVHQAVRYLVKDDQRLLLKPQGARCLRKGQVF
ncbi:YagK/YfjJ domain-containing protein [Pseudomonas juntendi]|uniref:YagK/YfjJ domain-containing protein n=1 Tax=Pseudomonas juntendi TaxID=2666183 RepID=UPI0027A54A38|nr:inovirus-type Gp2 protein [Pseudomonas juntendi]